MFAAWANQGVAPWQNGVDEGVAALLGQDPHEIAHKRRFAIAPESPARAAFHNGAIGQLHIIEAADALDDSSLVHHALRATKLVSCRRISLPSR